MRAVNEETPPVRSFDQPTGTPFREALRKQFRSWAVRDVVLPFLATRTMLALVGWLALLSFKNLPANPGSWEIKADGRLALATPYLAPDTYPLVNVFSRWDSGWYHSVAKNGYSFTPDKQSNTAFFPLYPMLMRAVHFLSPSQTDASWMIAGLIVSNAALLIAACYLVLLLRLDFDPDTSARAVLYLFIFPSTFFLSAVYSESLFLAATLAAFYHARKGQWLLASVCAGAATLTRSPGILLAAPLLLEYLAQRKFRLREIRWNVAALAIIPACLAAHMLYFHWRFGT
jgi:hypothetical protein